MNKNQKNILFIFTFLILYVCNSVSYTDLQYDHNKLMKKEILTLKGGGQNSVDKSIIGKKILLENLFPDSAERINFQKKQEKFYKSGQLKFQEAKKLRMSDESAMKILTDQEKDTLDYLNGTGNYEKYQNLKALPNFFDTRQSFLLKMQSGEMLKNFLNNYNNRYKKNFTVD